MLGLPNSVRACLFDLDGVLTRTAKVHAAAWKEMFDAFLRRRAEQTNTTYVPFDAVEDYDAYVDGKPRNDGTRSFLQARGITLPDGSPTDPPNAETVQGLGRMKNEIVLQMIQRKLARFASNRRAIIEYKVTTTPTGPYVQVMSTLE